MASQAEAKGKNASLWMSRAASTSSYPPLNSDVENIFDVIVVGAGIVGLTSALHLKRAGKRVAVLERHTVGSGTSGRSTAHISLHVDAHYEKIEKNFGKDVAALVYKGQIEARDEIARNCAELNIAGYEGPIDAYLYAEPGMDHSGIMKEFDSLQRAAIDSSLLGGKSPLSLPFSTDLALKIPGSAQFDSYRYCQGLARAVNGDGSAVFENTGVIKVKDGVPCEVETNFGVLRAPDVISATHTPIGISILHTALVPYTSFVLAVRVEQSIPPGLYYDTVDPYHYLRRLDAGNPNVIIVGGCDKKTGASSPTEIECFDDLRKYVAKRFKVQEEIAFWSAQHFSSPDGLPYVGTDPGSAHVWIAAGFSGDGLSLGTVSGKVLAQSILGLKHDLAPVYNSHRFKPLASAKQFLEEQLTVAKHMIVDRICVAGVSLQDIQPGEGRIAQMGVSKVAAYRDPAGVLHAHSAVCPHMKCIVNWNASEKTFDCPCHGSRFSATGSVLEGPALTDLEDMIEDVAAKAKH